MNLHIASPNKFTIPFFEFLRDHQIGHENIILSRSNSPWPEDIGFKNHAFGLCLFAFNLYKLGRKADRIILHGLFDPRLVIILFFQPFLLKKCYWMVFGADLYAYNLNNKSFKGKLKELFRKRVIKHIGYVITSIKGDYKNAVSWYGAQGKHLPYYAYPASLFSDLVTNNDEPIEREVRLLLGNSADPSNNHEEVLRQLSIFKADNISVYCPLSYGQKSYSDKILRLGHEILGEKFVPIVDFIAPQKYAEFLTTIDIAIFNHNRQQALSTTRVLLGYGKKVYMRTDTSSYDALVDLGLTVFDVKNINLETKFSEQEENKRIVRSVYSEQALRNNLTAILS